MRGCSAHRLTLAMLPARAAFLSTSATCAAPAMRAEANAGLATSREPIACVIYGSMNRDGNNRISSIKRDAYRMGARRGSGMNHETRAGI